MGKRIALYVALYGGIGAVVGALMALYTKDASAPSVALTMRPPMTMRPPVAANEPTTEGKRDE